MSFEGLVGKRNQLALPFVAHTRRAAQNYACYRADSPASVPVRGSCLDLIAASRGHPPQSLDIGDFDQALAPTDDAGLLQPVRDDRDRIALKADLAWSNFFVSRGAAPWCRAPARVMQPGGEMRCFGRPRRLRPGQNR